jgi:hypothetical protein
MIGVYGLQKTIVLKQRLEIKFWIYTTKIFYSNFNWCSQNSHSSPQISYRVVIITRMLLDFTGAVIFYPSVLKEYKNYELPVALFFLLFYLTDSKTKMRHRVESDGKVG